MKPHTLILLLPAAAVAAVLMNQNEDVLYGFVLGCLASFAVYFWRVTRKTD